MFLCHTHHKELHDTATYPFPSNGVLRTRCEICGVGAITNCLSYDEEKLNQMTTNSNWSLFEKALNVAKETCATERQKIDFTKRVMPHMHLSTDSFKKIICAAARELATSSQIDEVNDLLVKYGFETSKPVKKWIDVAISVEVDYDPATKKFSLNGHSAREAGELINKTVLDGKFERIYSNASLSKNNVWVRVKDSYEER